MDDLIEFLRAQLDEDERVAREATTGPWRHNPDKHWRKPGTSWFEEAVFAGPAGADATCVAGTGETDDPQSMADAEHIARWDPVRVLARVAADRRILELHSSPDPSCDACGWIQPCETVRLLALPYADKEGYRPEWRP
jgi:hypothetical protein